MTLTVENAKKMRNDHTNTKLLSQILAGNAGFGAVTGVILVVGAIPLSRWLGIPTWIAVAIGVGLLPFSFAVAVVARRPRRSTVRLVVAADLAWVAGAALVILGFPKSMSASGLWVLGMVTVAVADFALLQTVGLRRMETTT